MISVDEALGLLTQHRPDWGTQSLPLHEVKGHILAQDITAPFNHPSASVSVMDGYAFSAGEGDKRLTLIGESRAGEPFNGIVNKGQAVRIFTGALLPRGADTVEMQENAVTDEDGYVSFTSLSTHRNFVRKAGADFTKGDVLFRAGETVTPAMILGLATCNLDSINIQRKPVVALLSSGDELKPVGSILGKSHIVNSISPALSALLNDWGVTVINLGIAKDTSSDIRAKLETCKADIIVPIGAASVGDYDLMQPVAKALDFTPIFSKIAVKPGKPTWFSKRGHQSILGLPGNPSSAWVCAHIFLKHLILGPQNRESARAAQDIPANGKRESYLRGKILDNGRVTIMTRQDSGLVTPLSYADALIRRPVNGPALAAGDSIEIIKFNGFT